MLLSPLAETSTALCFDLGGTSIRGAVVTIGNGVVTNHGVLGQTAQKSSMDVRHAPDARRALAELLVSLTSEICAVVPAAVVLAVPGPVAAGRVSKLPTLLGASAVDLELVALARQCWPRSSIWVCNDLTAAGYGLVAEGWRDFLVVTCGSGIGAKLFLDGAPLLGRSGGGGEIGHWRVPGAPPQPCECGGAGHLGAIASGRGTEALVCKMALDDPDGFARSGLGADCGTASQISSRSIVAHYLAGDPWTIEAMSGPAAALGSSLALLHLASGVEDFFLTGGFGTALGSRFAHAVGRAAAAASWDSGIDWHRAVHATSPDAQLGLVGGLSYARSVPPDYRAEAG